MSSDKILKILKPILGSNEDLSAQQGDEISSLLYYLYFSLNEVYEERKGLSETYRVIKSLEEAFDILQKLLPNRPIDREQVERLFALLSPEKYGQYSAQDTFSFRAEDVIKTYVLLTFLQAFLNDPEFKERALRMERFDLALFILKRPEWTPLFGGKTGFLKDRYARFPDPTISEVEIPKVIKYTKVAMTELAPGYTFTDSFMEGLIGILKRLRYSYSGMTEEQRARYLTFLPPPLKNTPDKGDLQKAWIRSYVSGVRSQVGELQTSPPPPTKTPWTFENMGSFSYAPGRLGFYMSQKEPATHEQIDDLLQILETGFSMERVDTLFHESELKLTPSANKFVRNLVTLLYRRLTRFKTPTTFFELKQRIMEEAGKVALPTDNEDINILESIEADLEVAPDPSASLEPELVDRYIEDTLEFTIYGLARAASRDAELRTGLKQGERAQKITTYMLARAIHQSPMLMSIFGSNTPPSALSAPPSQRALDLVPKVKADAEATLKKEGSLDEEVVMALSSVIGTLMDYFLKEPFTPEATTEWLDQNFSVLFPSLVKEQNLESRLYQTLMGVILGGLVAQASQPITYEHLVFAINTNPYFDLIPYLKAA